MDYKYSYQGSKENTVKVVGKLLPISFKISTQIARFIRGKKLEYAIDILQKVQEQKTAVPYIKYRRDTPHRRGKMGPGRYPKKASSHIQKLLASLKANAMDLGMKPENITLIHVAVQKGPSLWHYGRHRGRQRKVCNFEVIGLEEKGKEPARKEKKPEPKPKVTKKVEKKEPKKEAPKEKPKEEKKEPKKEEKKKETKKEEKKESKVSQKGQEPKTKPEKEATPATTKAKQKETKKAK